MNLRLTRTIYLLLIFSSCKSLQHATSANSSRSSSASSKKRDVKFLNNVSINPGDKKSAGYTYNKSLNTRDKNTVNHYSSFNIEKANWLQIKYAIMMDMPVEDINNLQLFQQIDHWWGTRYCMGGDNESCIDCSAFTQTMLHNVYGVDVPRTADEQYDFSTHIKDNELQEGDLVFFKSGHSITHVGLYVANYKFVHASTSGGVTISDLNDSYWSKKYAGAGRVIK